MEQLTSKTNKEFSRKKYYLIYSGIFLFCSTLFILYLVLNGKTNINFKSDGMNQHYRALVYYSRYLKEIIRNLFVNHGLAIPLWDFSIGEGADIINVLHSDAIGDPLTFLSVLIPEKFLPAYYMFNAFIRVYLSGIFFSELCFYLKNRNMHSVLAGTLVYVFCYWSIQSLTFHIYFLTPFMYLPLIILGVEKIINDDKPYIFIIAVLLSSISWLYYFYMVALATAIYGILRTIFKYKKDVKAIINKLIHILLYAIVGLCMAMIVLMPMIRAYMSDSRMSNSTSVPLFYPWFFYERLFTIFVANDYPYDLCLGFVSPTLLAIVVLLKNYKKHSLLLLFNVLCAIFLIFPIFGKIWNGFSYVSQRWSFVVALPIAYDMVVAWDEFKENKKLLLFSLPVIFCAAFFSAWARNERVIIPVIICFVFCFVAVFDSKNKILKPKLRELLMFGLILLNVFYIYEYNLSPRGGDFINDLMSIEDVNKFTKTSEAYLMKEYTKNEKDFYRYTGNRLTNNASIMYDVHSTNFYWSITNPYDQVFRSELGIRDRLSWQLVGYDDRAELESLSNVKYYLYDKNYPGTVPYGFKYKDSLSEYELYENKNVLPFGYTYSKTMSIDDWNEYNPIDKQNIMMDRVVIDNNESSSNYETLAKTTYSITCEDGITIDGNAIHVLDDDAKISIVFDSDSNKEKYLLFEGLHYTDSEHLIEDDQTTTWVVCNSDDVSASFIYMPEGHRYAYDKTEYVCYLGETKQGTNTIDVMFSLPGTYTVDEISVVCKGMEDYKSRINDLASNHLENVKFDTNRVSGDIRLDESKYLVLSIPFSKGWKAKVDGNTAELLQANQHYMALYLEPGQHTIELTYTTPGLVVGSMVSVIGFALFGAIIYLNKKREKNEVNNIV